MDTTTIIAELKKFIETNILAGDISITADTVLQDAGIDSFSIVEIILFIERKYGVVIADDQLLPENFRTLTALAATVQALKA